MILGGRAQQRGSADIHVFDGGAKIAGGVSDCAFKWIEVDDHKIDIGDVIRRQGFVIHPPPAENAGVNSRMQRLDAAPDHLGKARVGGNLGDGHTAILEQTRRTAGG